ncbi:MAG: hypothetical protein C4K47_05035 [Candidatus Thorarchaeota archaeon]|nr:MAG: hypothetical protein C4K47_05035 [Candidatus Thorarchaeota archaeon]
MTIAKILKAALEYSRKAVLENLQRAAESTDSLNPFGDVTLAADILAEDEIIRVLHESGLGFNILTEERGLIEAESLPEFLAVVDPLDGSANFERGLPLCCGGISVIPFSDQMTTDRIETSVISSYFTKDVYVAVTGKGVRRNGKSVSVASPKHVEESVVSYDTKASWLGDFASGSLRVLGHVKDMRRAGSNLLDLCWTACGVLDAMVDLRDILPIVHVSGTHIVCEAGGFVIAANGSRLLLPLRIDCRMSFVAASTKELAREILRLFQGGR